MSPRRKLVLVSGLLAAGTATWIAAENSASGNENLPIGAMRQKATAACLECHEARIILQQRLTKAAWTREVDKMVKWGALVDASDRDALIDYLSVNFGPEESAYNAPRAARENSHGKKMAEKSAR